MEFGGGNVESGDEEEVDFSEINRFESMTQNSTQKIEFDKQKGHLVNNYYYGFLLDWQLLVNSHNMKIQEGPTLLMELCYTDSWGRYSLEGYAFCEIPKEPGTFEITVPAWRPKGGSNTDVMNFFLGGTLRVRDLHEIASPSFNIGDNIAASMNRFTTRTISAGTVKLKFHITHQDWYNFIALLLQGIEEQRKKYQKGRASQIEQDYVQSNERGQQEVGWSSVFTGKHRRVSQQIQ